MFVIGRPEVTGHIITFKQSLEMIFASLGKEPRLVSVPDWLVLALIGVTGFLGKFIRKVGVFSEFLKICYY